VDAHAAANAVATHDAIAFIEAASTPLELFGADLAEAARRYRRLARLTHPDACPGDAQAAAAFGRLTELWRCHIGRRGPDGPPLDVSPDDLFARGDVANLYQAPGGLLKVARDPADNDLLDREATALTAIRRHAPARLSAYLPRLERSWRLADPRTGVVRHANLIGRLAGFVSLTDVRAAYRSGIHPADAAWMWRRLLVALGIAHRAGYVHGAVLPEHVLIHPADHGLVLVDWCYAGRPGAPLPAIVARHRNWYPPDVLLGQPAGQDADIWLATSCLTDLVGDQMPASLAAFARGCMLANPARRPQDAWLLLRELDEVLGRLYGPRRFRPFQMPGGPA
jgi:hypothetical protein